MANAIPEDRQRQFDRLALAEQQLFAWSAQAHFPLHQVEFIVPFVATDFHAHVLLFVATRQQVQVEAGSRFREAQAVFVSALRHAGYPEADLALLTFELDSHERVQREFGGSYFSRLR
jgi:hypothetical protein